MRSSVLGLALAAVALAAGITASPRASPLGVEAPALTTVQVDGFERPMLDVSRYLVVDTGKVAREGYQPALEAPVLERELRQLQVQPRVWVQPKVVPVAPYRAAWRSPRTREPTPGADPIYQPNLLANVEDG